MPIKKLTEYATALSVSWLQPGLTGSLVVKLDSPGKVLSSSVTSSTLGSPAVERCFEQRLQQVDSQQHDGQKGRVRVPIAID